MKVIFLDIDGVLNSEEFLKTNQNEIVDRNNMNMLKNIIDKTGAVIVMSSGWKLWFDDNMMPKKEEINSHLVRTNAQIGITEDDAKRAIDMINLK